MAESEQNRERFQVAYVGDDENDHNMDVDALGPALLAFGQLIRAANTELNQARATMKVLVNSKFEHKCFLINFETLQTILDTVKNFLNDEGVKHAADVLQKLGVTAGTTTAGLFAYLKWRNGRKVESAQEVKDSPGAVVIKVEGDNNIHANGPGRLSDAAFDLEIRTKLSRVTYQYPDEIADGIRMISPVELWNEIAKHHGAAPSDAATDAKLFKGELTQIVNRRNKIVHEGDLQPSTPRIPWPISRSQVDHVKTTIGRVVMGIEAKV